MLDRIEHQTTTLRTAFDSIAHDLRTPLYRLRMRLEEAQLRAHVAGSWSSRRRWTRSIACSARWERCWPSRVPKRSGVTTHGDEVDLAALASNMVELYAPGMRAAGLEVTLEAPEPAPLTGNRQLLAQLITNLLENALKYVPAGGHVWVRVRNRAGGQR